MHEHLRDAHDELTQDVLNHLLKRIPGYRAMPREQFDGEIREAVAVIIDRFTETVRTRRLPTADELAKVESSGARRAEEGIPADVVIEAFHVGVRVGWERLVALAGPDDVPTLWALVSLALEYLRGMSAALTSGYLALRQVTFGDEHAARHTLLTALLSGADAREAARLAGIRLPAAYLVLSLAVATHPDTAASGVDPVIVERRKLRRVRVELMRHTGDRLLSALSVEGGLALVPQTERHDELAPAQWSWVTRLCADLARSAGAPVTVTVVPAVPEAVATAATLSREVLEVVTAAGFAPGAYRLSDVLLEYQLTRPSAALPALAALLDPIAGHPDLEATLRGHVRTGLSRRQTADALHVHPNTVDYRLRKIASLTGLDVTRPADLPRIRAALAARVTLARPDTPAAESVR